jgi:DNA-binding transcriptional LysR family regulator
MTLKQLEAFYWAATCASFSIAAERLHLSVSSLSKRVSELEASLGLSLFDRRGQRARLTEAGQKLRPRAQALLLQAQQVRESMEGDADVQGVCRFGVGELTALTWLPRLVSAARKRYPDLRLEPHVEVGGELERKVREGVLDFAVIAGVSMDPDIASRPIGQARFKWCAAPQAAGSASTVSHALLARCPIVTLPKGAGTTRILEDWLAASGMTADQHLTCNSWGAVAGLLLEGIGVGFLPVGWADALARHGVLRVLRAQPALRPLPYSFQWHREDKRVLIEGMHELVRASIDFDLPVRLL